MLNAQQQKINSQPSSPALVESHRCSVTLLQKCQFQGPVSSIISSNDRTMRHNYTWRESNKYIQY